MTVNDIAKETSFKLAAGTPSSRKISHIFCCDLLSIAMAKAPQYCAWVTVMGNKNTLAVASLTETACIILAEGIHLNEADKACADKENIPVFETELPVFDAALLIYQLGEKL